MYPEFNPWAVSLICLFGLVISILTILAEADIAIAENGYPVVKKSHLAWLAVGTALFSLTILVVIGMFEGVSYLIHHTIPFLLSF